MKTQSTNEDTNSFELGIHSWTSPFAFCFLNHNSLCITTWWYIFILIIQEA